MSPPPQIPLPEQPAWFLLFGSAEEDLKEICRRILRLYALPSVPLAALLLQVDKCRQAMDSLAAKAKAAGTVLLSISTPTLDSPANFSPASKAGMDDEPLALFFFLRNQALMIQAPPSPLERYLCFGSLC